MPGADGTIPAGHSPARRCEEVTVSLSGPTRQHAGPPPAAERERFDRNGFLVIRGALTPDEAGFYRDARFLPMPQ